MADEMSGFLNIDKPAEKTSHDVCEIIRRMINVDKCGHAGTLDPAVTGVLPVAIGKATRLLRYLKHDKEYVGTMWIHQDIELKELKKIIKSDFIGKIRQTPPVKSRVKRVEREREIYSFKILEQKGKKVLFKVHCEAGTYIRKLVDDLGRKLNIGAHMTELRRIKAGELSEENSITLYQLREAVEKNCLQKYILPPEIIAKDMLKIEVNENSLEKLYNGSPVYGEYIKKKGRLKMGDKIAVMFNKKLVEIANVVLEGNKIAVPEIVFK